MSPIGIAIFGAGLFAKQAHLPAIKALPTNTATLKAVYSRSTKSSKSLAEFATSELAYTTSIDAYSSEEGGDKSLDALLKRDDIHVIIVVMPINSQLEMVFKCLAAGKHVLSEKPIGPTVKAAQEAVALYKEKYQGLGLHWRVAENFEVEPTYLHAKKVIESGAIGDVGFFRLSGVNYVDEKTNQYALTSWRAVPEYQGGFLLDGGVHSVAILRTILPSKMISLSAFASLVRPPLLPHDTIQAIVSLSPSASEPNGTPAHGIFELSFGAPSPERSETALNGHGVIVTGTKGFLSLTNVTMDDGNTYFRAETTINGAAEPEVFESQTQGVEREVENFVKLVSGGGDTGFGTLEGTLSDVAFIEAALTSQGKPVELI